VIIILEDLKVFLKLKKPLKKVSLLGKFIYKKEPKKNPKKTKKNKKKTKNPLGWVKKKTGFFQPCLQERVGDEGDGTVLVDGAVVALQARREVRKVVGQLLDHQGSHLPAPDRLRGVIFTCQICPIRSFL
jgi:hypothetical protein